MGILTITPASCHFTHNILAYSCMLLGGYLLILRMILLLYFISAVGENENVCS